MNDFAINHYKQLHHLKNQDIYRIIENFGTEYTIVNPNGVTQIAKLKSHNIDFVVGDFVTITAHNNEIYLNECLPRTTLISKAASTTSKSLHISTDEQIFAANIDQIYIFIAADQRFTLGKLERYLLVFGSMVDQITVIISKSDYLQEADSIFYEIIATYPTLNVLKLSTLNLDSITTVKNTIQKGKTAILIGASGAGKSTFINALNGEAITQTGAVRTDGKGKHTTTNSRIYYNPSTESYIMDSPGFKTIDTHREIDTDILFNDINTLALSCKFNDCQHRSEPGCAVKNAIKTGQLSQDLLDRYFYTLEKMLKYERYLQRKARGNAK